MNVLIVEDHPIFRIGVRQLLVQRWPNAQIEEAANLNDAITDLKTHEWHIGLVDLNLPDANGVEIITKLLKSQPQLKILVLSMNSDVFYAQRVLQFGAMGYLDKSQATTDLITAIERIMNGGRYVSPSLAEHLVKNVTGMHHPQLHESLSDQEYRVMMQLAMGKRINEIAEGMNLSSKTISTYRSRVLEKLDIASNAELAAYCIYHGLLTEQY
ncbi:LuxR family transcriptional regulator [Novimethylophilus kurashikiensis]|uniref:LuxR family transcriptional regulator n=1 Tax=Novimethylophilus kurashikiensis TaxID=1825523 RepID=A0A2R5F1K5_9PROT|nr:response regulator transcription factor [Novimethylophilus kurashikiensis]GBG12587.1 LuxR family transcriptional regulator [Novimethylophilus kurashikiensis]